MQYVHETIITAGQKYYLKSKPVTKEKQSVPHSKYIHER